MSSFIEGDKKKLSIKIKEDKKAFLISEYDSLEILKPNIFLYLCLFLTSYFLYLKITARFITLWRLLSIYIISNFFKLIFTF